MKYFNFLSQTIFPAAIVWLFSGSIQCGFLTQFILWLITDFVFYKKRGWEVVSIHLTTMLIVYFI